MAAIQTPDLPILLKVIYVMQMDQLARKIQVELFSTALKVEMENLLGEQCSQVVAMDLATVREVVQATVREVVLDHQEVARNNLHTYLANLELLVLRMAR